jgi:hypothetical protein
VDLIVKAEIAETLQNNLSIDDDEKLSLRRRDVDDFRELQKQQFKGLEKMKQI